MLYSLSTAITSLPLTACRPPDPRTAVELERDAQHKRANAAQIEALVRVQQTTMPVPSVSEAERTGPGPPPELYAGVKRDADIAAARDLEGRARKIRAEAGAACRDVPPEEQKTCPLPGGPLRAQATPRGVRLIPERAAPAEALRAQIHCAIARSHVERPPDFAVCPLHVPGVAVRVVDRPDGVQVEITAPTEDAGREVRRRVRQIIPRAGDEPAAP